MKKLLLAYGPIWAVLFGAHFMVLLAAGSHWDGALLSYLAAKGDMTTIHTWLDSSGLYPHDYIYRTLALAGSYFPFVARFVSVLGLGVAASFAYRLLTESMALPRAYALFICQIMVCWPFLHMLMIETMVAQMVLMACFYGGWFLYVNNGRNIVLRALGCALILVSFYHGLYLLVHLALFASLCCAHSSGWKNYLRKHGFIILLPFIFFAFKTFFIPLSGPYAEMHYNVPLFLLEGAEFWNSILRILWLMFDGMLNALAHPFYLAFAMFNAWPLTLLGLLLGIIWVGGRGMFADIAEVSTFRKGWLLVCGCLLFGSVIFAHAVVGQNVQLADPLARNGSHAGIGFGFIVLALLLMLPERLKKIRRPLSVFIIVAFTLATFYAHTMWIARQAKDAAVIHILASHDFDPKISIYLFEDTDEYRGWGWPNDYFERTIMIQNILGKDGILGATTLVLMDKNPEAAMKDMQKFLGYDNIRVQIPEGTPGQLCAAAIIISPKNHLHASMAAFQYLYYTWLDKKALNPWLEALVNIKVEYFNLRGNHGDCK